MRQLAASAKVSQLGRFRLIFAAASDASIYSQSLELRGDGVNDISFAVADLEYETARLQEKGVAWLGTTADGNSRYFDTRGEGNIMLRLVQS